jgi:hypothetical protein
MHDNFFKEREFALDVIEAPNDVFMEENGTKYRGDLNTLKFNVFFV